MQQLMHTVLERYERYGAPAGLSSRSSASLFLNEIISGQQTDKQITKYLYIAIMPTLCKAFQTAYGRVRKIYHLCSIAVSTHLPKVGRKHGNSAHLPKVGKGGTEGKCRYRRCGGHGLGTHLPKVRRFRGETAHLPKVGRFRGKTAHLPKVRKAGAEGKRGYRRCGGHGKNTHLPKVGRFRGKIAHLPKVRKAGAEGKRGYRRCGGHGENTHLPKVGRFRGETAHLPKVGMD